ncbi:uncharacterized protein SOCEGT47_019180 [Sorangium cellulosum]|uniref:Uncharacterized protein n=1 Tax=Sorangium cellulosum TaxID=56 RepID=A0A3Q8I2H8_SORCE|nr:uncharacterized protein SOCEGT47_019180 [Sorangium cellulosum]AYM53047.1 hypothetical protein [Sorangium cellulosum]
MRARLRVVRRSKRTPSRSSSRARRRLMVARGTPSSAAARDRDRASTVFEKARSSAVSRGSSIWIKSWQVLPTVDALIQARPVLRILAHERQKKSILLINLGHGDPAKLYPRNPRLDFEEACPSA